jgi:galactokinase
MPEPSFDFIRERFAAAYGEPPVVIARAPGRVNLIGEHTDYSELPVLPIAIERSLFIAASSSPGGEIEALSTAFEPPARFARSESHPSGAPWHRYLAGAIAELAEPNPSQGAKLLIDGDLPASGGLSSSSALSVGLLAALSAAWGGPLDREELVRLAIVAERHVGVESGGMDQAIITFAEPGHALRIDFRPAGRRQVLLPEGLAFVVASSGEDAPKGGAARDSYNERVVGARIAAVMIADEVGVDLDQPVTLGQVSDIDVVDILVDGLPEKISAREVAHGAHVDIAHIVQLTAETWDAQVKVPVKRVARHILAEAQRVQEAEEALRDGDLRAFGKILDASHNSLREDLRCSTPALDKLCAAMRKAGALGSRLTGAGFGGFALAVCTPENVQKVIEAAVAATGGPAFEVHASGGLEIR